MLGAEDALGAGQISVFMCDTRDDPARERQYLEMLLRRQVDGLIVTGRRIEPRPSIGTGLGIPVVYAMTQSLTATSPRSCPTTTAAAALAASHFAGGRARRLGHITGPERFLAARRRAGGFWRAAAAGVPGLPAKRRALRRVERGAGAAPRPRSCCATARTSRPSSAAATSSPAG